MGRHTITISESDKLWIDAQIEAGRFKTAKEAVTNLIQRADPFRPFTDEDLRVELQKGRDSGYIEVNRDSFLAELKAKYA